MSEYTIRHPIACTSETYWKCLFNEEYTRRLYLDTLQFRDATILECKTDVNSTFRRIYLNPPAQNLPAPIAKIVGDTSWIEEGAYELKTSRYEFRVIPSSQPEKTRIQGEMWCEPRSNGQIERIAKISIEVKIMLVGTLIEKMIVNDMLKSYEKAAEFTSIFVREKGW